MKTQHLILKERNGLTRIQVDRISKIVVNGDCVTLYVEKNKKFVASKSLQSLKKNLPDDFVFISRNIIVNTLKAIRLQPRERILTLENGEELQVATRRVKDLKRFFSGSA